MESVVVLVFLLLFVCLCLSLCRLYQCPQCQKSIVDMSSAWRRNDEERQLWQMPHHLRDFKVKVNKTLILW